jgi:hypothetical protein
LPASLRNATYRPSAEIVAPLLAPSACVPSAAVLTRVIAPVLRSLTKMSCRPFVSPPVRSPEPLSKTT